MKSEIRTYLVKYLFRFVKYVCHYVLMLNIRPKEKQIPFSEENKSEFLYHCLLLKWVQRCSFTCQCGRSLTLFVEYSFFSTPWLSSTRHLKSITMIHTNVLRGHPKTSLTVSPLF